MRFPCWWDFWYLLEDLGLGWRCWHVGRCWCRVLVELISKTPGVGAQGTTCFPRGPVWPFQPSMTADAAIRIDLHSAEVAHFAHTNRCNAPNFGSNKNLIIKDPKFWGNKKFLKCLVNGYVYPLISLLGMLCFVFVLITPLGINPKTQTSCNRTSSNNVLINKTVHISSTILCLTLTMMFWS